MKNMFFITTISLKYSGTKQHTADEGIVRMGCLVIGALLSPQYVNDVFQCKHGQNLSFISNKSLLNSVFQG